MSCSFLYLNSTLVLFALLIAPAFCADGEQGEGQGEKRSGEDFAHFEKHIRPVFSLTCVKCHGPDKQEGGLRLDSKAALLKGGESGPAVVPGDPAKSLLLSALRYEELEMPPTKPLELEQIDRVVAWIQQGAPWPEDGKVIRPPTGEITDADRAWWAFQPVTEPIVPPPSFAHMKDLPEGNEVDRFVHRRLAERGMEPAVEADRTKLVRRLYQAVVGLPPSPVEIDAFVNDTSSDAYERLVDKLLGDERYGEHWARFWLDLVRYAESDGWKADAYRPNIWRYRDYVVNAFNNDKPYTEFVREQLAGDELDNPTPDALAATGYLRLGIFEYNQRNSRQHWDDILNEITDVTGDVFLGIGMACARCHDHKFDPLLQVDYYKLRAFFEPIVFDDKVRHATSEQIAEYERKHQEWLVATKDVRREIDALTEPYHSKKQKATIAKFPLDIQASYFKPREERNSWDQQMTYFIERQFYEEGGDPLDKIKGADKKSHESLQEKLKEFEDSKPSSLPSLMSVMNYAGDYAATSLADRKDEIVEPGFVRVLSETVGPEFPNVGRDRRTSLANWIASPDNPLTTRVIVNRIWKQHFGQGIVRSTSDFGTLGGRPSHPELLDWLTSKFVADGWSIKSLHKRILMSATWRQATTHKDADEYETLDPQNKLLWRRTVRRLTAEQIRDAMLVASGELETKLSGPSVKGDVPRRSLYVKSFRNNPDRFLHAFDVANGLKSVGQRSSTTTPTQALMMINGEFTFERAKRMAKQLGEIDDRKERVRHAILSTWCREPTTNELEKSVRFVASDSTQEDYERLTDFCHVLLNSNEFLYVD